ncbi:MAG: hypothetical protein Q4F21_12175 [Lachnospiraceae bacterium]|nr:hypothetical protein [Lachnospiraceae bacterium]
MHNLMRDEESRELLVQQYYQQIMSCWGMEQIKSIVRKWELLRTNVGSFPADEPVLLPEYLWFSRSGTGKSEMLQLLAGYLDAAQIMPFNGMEKVIEFTLEYCEENEPFTELENLIKYLSASSGYHNEFKGILAVNLDNWLPHLDNPHFIEFLEFLSEHNRSLLLILIAWPDENYMDKLEKMLSVYLRIHTVMIEMPKAQEMFDFIEVKLERYHCRLSEEAGSILLKTLAVLRDLEGFDGYKTLEFMVQEIVYNYYCGNEVASHVIGPEVLEEFRADGRFISQYKKRYDRKERLRSAGFRPGF